MDKKMIEKFRKCIPYETYYVEGYELVDDVKNIYWYLFECTSVNKFTIKGDDIVDWKDESMKGWSMDLIISKNENEGIVTKIQKKSIEELKNQKPEYFL